MTQPDWRQSRDHRLGFGKYRGMTIDAVASTDEGLLWLDWASGTGTGSGAREDVRMIQVYLSDPTISRELDAVLAKRRRA